MFYGHSSHNVDDKGRLHLSSKFRSKLGEKLYISIGLGKKLELFPSEQFDERSKYLEKMPFGKKEVRAFKEAFYGYTFELSVDKSGRILLPKELVSYANIEKEVVITGNGKSILIWDKNEFNNFSKEAIPKLEELADKIADIDI